MTWKPRSGEGYGALGVIAVDTNVVVRLLARDDEVQYQASRTLFETHEIFIPDTVVNNPYAGLARRLFEV